jgi:hypothetical protein
VGLIPPDLRLQPVYRRGGAGASTVTYTKRRGWFAKERSKLRNQAANLSKAPGPATRSTRSTRSVPTGPTGPTDPTDPTDPFLLDRRLVWV